MRRRPAFAFTNAGKSEKTVRKRKETVIAMDMKETHTASAPAGAIDMEKLEKLAEVAVRVGLDLQEGQCLNFHAGHVAAPRR